MSDAHPPFAIRHYGAPVTDFDRAATKADDAGASCSIVIPAHNEEAVIGRCLGGILEDAADAEFEIIVVANACTDDTAAIATSFAPSVRVIETHVASKPHSLNVADRQTDVFPRIYLDADIEFDAEGIRTLVSALDNPGVRAAAPVVAIDTEGAAWPVISYYRIWRELPSIKTGLMGRGVYALDAAGRARFTEFPETMAEDQWLHEQFSSAERTSVDEVSSLIRPPRTFRSLFTRKVRTFVGTGQVRQLSTAPAATDNTAWLRVVARNPRLLLDVPLYAAITVGAKLLARRLIRKGDNTWTRDETSR